MDENLKKLKEKNNKIPQIVIDKHKSEAIFFSGYMEENSKIPIKSPNKSLIAQTILNRGNRNRSGSSPYRGQTEIRMNNKKQTKLLAALGNLMAKRILNKSKSESSISMNSWDLAYTAKIRSHETSDKELIKNAQEASKRRAKEGVEEFEFINTEEFEKDEMKNNLYKMPQAWKKQIEQNLTKKKVNSSTQNLERESAFIAPKEEPLNQESVKKLYQKHVSLSLFGRKSSYHHLNKNLTLKNSQIVVENSSKEKTHQMDCFLRFVPSHISDTIVSEGIIFVHSLVVPSTFLFDHLSNLYIHQNVSENLSLSNRDIVNFIGKWIHLLPRDFCEDFVLAKKLFDFLNYLNEDKNNISLSYSALLRNIHDQSIQKLTNDISSRILSNEEILRMAESGSNEVAIKINSKTFPIKNDNKLSPIRTSSQGGLKEKPPIYKTHSYNMFDYEKKKHENEKKNEKDEKRKKKREKISKEFSSLSNQSDHSSFERNHHPNPISFKIGTKLLIYLTQQINLNEPVVLLEISPSEIAKQWTHIDQSILSTIAVREMLLNVSNPSKCKSLTRMADRFNHSTSWTALQVLKTPNFKKRSLVITHLIAVAEELLNLSNLHGFIAIVLGLNQLCISRLHATWKRIDAKVKKTFENMTNLASPIGNFRLLRPIHEKAIPPFIPTPAMFLKDILFVLEGNGGYLVQNSIVKTDMIVVFHKILSRINQAQNYKYKFFGIQPIQNWLQTGSSLSNEELLKLSEKLESGRDD